MTAILSCYEHARPDADQKEAAICVASQVFATIGFLATASRMMWAFARDRGLPFSDHLAKVGSNIPISNRIHFRNLVGSDIWHIGGSQKRSATLQHRGNCSHQLRIGPHQHWFKYGLPSIHHTCGFLIL